MVDDSKHKGWKWSEVEDLEGWQRPDGPVVGLIYSLGQDPTIKVYDLGCGVGRHTVFFASQGYQVAASDISEEAVVKTKEWLKKAGLTADVQQGCMTEINQPDNEFDLVVCFNVIYHGFKKDIIKTIGEIYRILKPGGTLYCTIKAKVENTPFDEKDEIIDDQTIITRGGIEDGIPHFFSRKKDLLEFFENYEILSMVYCELYWQPFNFENFLNKSGKGYFRVHVKKPL